MFEEKDIIRFKSKVEVKSEDECWPWHGSMASFGYGNIKIKGKTYPAHKAAWIIANGEIPAGSWLRRNCDSNSCMNVKHMCLRTIGEDEIEIKSSADLTEKQIQSFWDRVDVKDNIEECWPWKEWTDRDGYGRVGFGLKTQFRTHKLAYELANGVIEDNELCVLHRCDVRACCNHHHLFLGTQQDNVADKMKKNRHCDCSGENNGCVKVTEKQVIEIRNLYNSTKHLSKCDPERYTQDKLASMYTVSRGCIKGIISNINWKYLL